MYKSPSKEQLDTLIQYYQTKDYKNAEKLAIILTKDFPDNELPWKILSITQKKSGKISDSLIAIQKIIEINPKNYLAHYNLGNSYKELGNYYAAKKIRESDS